MEELKILNKQVSEQKKPSKVRLSSNNFVASDLGKRFSKGPKLSMRLDRKSKLSIPESILVSEEEQLKIERENVNQILGAFKDAERKNNQNEDTMQRIDKVNTENLKMRANKLDDKKNFNCFVQKDDDEVDCRYATFRSDMYFFGHFTLFMMGIATIFNLISYYEIDYPVFFSKYALTEFNITEANTIEKIYNQTKEIEPRLDTYKSYSLYSLLLCHLLSLTSRIIELIQRSF